MPALAIADALRDKGALVTFLGTAERAEATLVPEAGYEIDFLRVRGIDRSNPLRAVEALGLAARAVPAARKALRARGAQAVLGGGGYVAAPAGLAARGLRLPLVLTESDRHLGLANRLLARRARRVCLAFPIPGLEGERYMVTGRPVPRAVLEADRESARAEFGLSPTSAASSSSAAARARSRSTPPSSRPARARPRIPRPVRTGTRDHALVSERVAAAGAEERFTVLEYLPNLGAALAASDLVLARSGASVFELAAAGRPAILVPYPYATGRHQHLNAEWMAGAGAAVVVEDEDLTASGCVLSQPSCSGTTRDFASMAEASAAVAVTDAAERIADNVLSCDRRCRMSEASWSGRKLHFIAIGGAGMSGLALVAHRLGASVTGSDRSESGYVERLRAAGLQPAMDTTLRSFRPTQRWWSRPRSPRTILSFNARVSATSAYFTAARCSPSCAGRSSRSPSPAPTARRPRRE